MKMAQNRWDQCGVHELKCNLMCMAWQYTVNVEMIYICVPSNFTIWCLRGQMDPLKSQSSMAHVTVTVYTVLTNLS